MHQRDSLIALGKIMGVHGVRGWVKIYSDCRPRTSIFNYKKFTILKPNKESITLKLVNGRPQGKGLVALFEGISNRDAAIELNGSEICVLRDELPELKDNEYYWQDLFGLKVINREGKALGTVVKIIETGANDVLIIKNSQGAEILIPLVSNYYIDRIDYDAQEIYVDWQDAWNTPDSE